MSHTTTSGPRRQDLPRLVDQVRALLVFQFYATMAALLGVLLFGGLAASSPAGRDIGDFVITAMFVLAGLAVPIWLGSRLWSRGWSWVYLMVVLAEAGTIAAAVFFFRSGAALGLGSAVYLGLTGWILVDLCRGEVRRFFF
jgi:hypothetical protein